MSRLSQHVLCAGFFLAVSVFGQTVTTAPAFEAVSIKPTEPGRQGAGILFQRGGRVVTNNAPLKALIAVAYDLPSNRILGGPAWLSSDRFDINAKPEGSITVSTQDGVAQIRLMLQAMLAERFKLGVHWETKEAPVYALMVDKNGPKMKAVPGGNGEGSATGGRGTLSGLAPMVRLARELSNFLGRPVLDQTGLQGRFEFKLEWTPDQSPASDAGLSNDDLGGSLFTAIKEQLGLRLQSQRGSVSFLIVDRAGKASEN